jgi:hypothetical protein
MVAIAKKTARFIGTVNLQATGDQRLYELSPPLLEEPWFDDDDQPVKHHRFVVVSAVVALYSGPETYIFPSDEKGNITYWIELEGSFRGALNHEAALQGAGYEVEEAEDA